jgi:hypothetical protein
MRADQAAVLAALYRLPAHQRAVLVLHYWAGLTEIEVGEVLRIEPEAVRAAAHDALTALTTGLHDQDPGTIEERLAAALQARAEPLHPRPAPPPARVAAEPHRLLSRTAARWLSVGATAALVCAVMAAVTAVSMGPGPAPYRPDTRRPSTQVIHRVGPELTVATERLRFPVSAPVSSVVRQRMPFGGGSCYAFDYPMQADGRPDPSVQMYAAGGCRGGIVTAPRRPSTARPPEPFAKTSAHVRLGACTADEQDLAVTAGGLVAEHTVYHCAVGPVEEWVFREDVVWSLDGGRRAAAMVGQAVPLVGTVVEAG